MTFDKCPTCGSEVTVVGKTTQHYEPVYNSENWNLLVRAKLAVDGEVRKLRAAMEFIPELVQVLENDPDISDITQFTNEIYDARDALGVG